MKVIATLLIIVTPLCQKLWGQDEFENFDNFFAAEQPKVDIDQESAIQKSHSLSFQLGYFLKPHQSASGHQFSGVGQSAIALSSELDIKITDQISFHSDKYYQYDLYYHFDDKYTNEYLSAYRKTYDISEAYFHYSYDSRGGVRLGRQIFNWGLSDTLRVLDLLNPTDALIPGAADVSDLHLGITALSWQQGLSKSWQMQWVIPLEHRPHRLPVYGSDFHQGEALSLPQKRWQKAPDVSLRITGSAKGSDLVFQIGQATSHAPYSVLNADQNNKNYLFDKYEYLGVGQVFTLGAMVFRYETLAKKAVKRNRLIEGVQLGTVSNQDYLGLIGADYHLPDDYLLAVDVAHQIISDFDASQVFFGMEKRQTSSTLTLSKSFLRDSLDGFVSLYFINEDLAVGRVQSTFEHSDTLFSEMKLLIYGDTDAPLFDGSQDNHRFFYKLSLTF